MLKNKLYLVSPTKSSNPEKQNNFKLLTNSGIRYGNF